MLRVDIAFQRTDFTQVRLRAARTKLIGPTRPDPSTHAAILTLENHLRRTSRCFAAALFMAATDRRALLLSFLHSWAAVRGGVVAVSSKISAEPVRLHRARVKRYLAPWRSRGAWAASRRKALVVITPRLKFRAPASLDTESTCM